MRRLDYTAEVVGQWAHAAHFCEGYRDFGGFKAPTRRRVRPLWWGSRPLPGPTLVALEIHDIRLTRKIRRTAKDNPRDPRRLKTTAVQQLQ
ncbi:MAG: hypothetical protein HGA63_07210 [Syntrophobacteraceae bacterium]|nr:hypothetical protein [Syntrophobacteraceae bacterium]